MRVDLRAFAATVTVGDALSCTGPAFVPWPRRLVVLGTQGRSRQEAKRRTPLDQALTASSSGSTKRLSSSMMGLDSIQARAPAVNGKSPRRRPGRQSGASFLPSFLLLVIVGDRARHRRRSLLRACGIR